MAMTNNYFEVTPYLLKLLAKYRCGFDNAKAEFYYDALMDTCNFIAAGNVEIIYKFKYKYDKEELAQFLIPKWADPIC